MDPVSAALSFYLTDQLQSPLKIFQETLLQLCNRIKLQTGNVIYFLGCQLWEKERGNNSYFAGPWFRSARIFWIKMIYDYLCIKLIFDWIDVQKQIWIWLIKIFVLVTCYWSYVDWYIIRHQCIPWITNILLCKKVHLPL